MAYNRAMMRMIKEKTAQQTDDWPVSGKTKFHSSDDAIKCDMLLVPHQKIILEDQV